MLKKVMIRKMNDYARFCKQYCNNLSNDELIFNVDFKKYFQKGKGFIISYNIKSKKEETIFSDVCRVIIGKQCEFCDCKFNKGSTLHFYHRIEDEIDKIIECKE